MKTEKTRKTNIQEIIIPLTQPLKVVLNEVANSTSKFVIGPISEGCSGQWIGNKMHKVPCQVNLELKEISRKLNLSVTLIQPKSGTGMPVF